MSGSNYLGRAGAYALHKRYPAGSQTAAQLAAERANLIKAREARGLFHHTRSAYYRGLRRSSWKSRGDVAAARAFKARDMQYMRNRTIGITYIKLKMKYTERHFRITGYYHKFVKDIGAVRATGTGWGKSVKQAHFVKRLRIRQHRLKRMKDWRHKRKTFTPR
jgi:hypothetical protein